jgi:hypothetical protein
VQEVIRKVLGKANESLESSSSGGWSATSYRRIEFSSVEDQYRARPYLDNDKREYELAKQVSVRLIDPRALS